jgi:site-specific DNA-methyltransferase (adenine-specific)
MVQNYRPSNYDETAGATRLGKLEATTDEAKQWDGWGTALKPAHEPIVVARKPVIGTVAENVLKYGVGGINVDACRISTNEADVKELNRGNKRPTGNNYRDSTFFRIQIEDRENKTTQGRWPANIILDEFTAELLDQQSGVSKSLAHNRPHDTKWGFSVAKDTPEGYDYNSGITGYSDSGGASRFFYVAKASKRDRNEGLDDVEAQSIGDKGNGLGRTCATCNASVIDGYDCPDRTFINPVRKNFHPTVKPTALMQYLIRLVTPENGTVLDPFCGSGSTGKAAILENKSFIGIELTPEYLPIIEGRLKHAYLTLDDKEADLFG